MNPRSKRRSSYPEAHHADPILVEVDHLIATAEARIAHQRQYVRSVASDFDASMKAVADLDRMTSGLDKLKTYRASIIGEGQDSLQSEMPAATANVLQRKPDDDGNA